MMEVNLIILPKNNSDINLGMKKQITDLFKSMFDDVSDNTFSVQIDDKSILVEYLISSKDKNMLFLKLSCEGKRAVQLKASDYDYYDYLIGMDTMNIRNMERMTGHKAGTKMRMLLEYNNQFSGISDPWYSGAFDETYRDVVTGCTAFLEYLEKEGKI